MPKEVYRCYHITKIMWLKVEAIICRNDDPGGLTLVYVGNSIIALFKHKQQSNLALNDTAVLAFTECRFSDVRLT